MCGPQSFRGIFYEVLWTLKLKQSQVVIVRLNSINVLISYLAAWNSVRANLRKRTDYLTCLVIFTHRGIFNTHYFNTALTQNILDRCCFEKVQNNDMFNAYRKSHLVVLGSEVMPFSPLSYSDIFAFVSLCQHP